MILACVKTETHYSSPGSADVHADFLIFYRENMENTTVFYCGNEYLLKAGEHSRHYFKKTLSELVSKGI